MINHGKQNVLGVGINAVDYDAAVEAIISAAYDRRSFAVSAMAVHGVMTGATDSVHRHRLNQFEMLVPDGQPVRWAVQWLHKVKLPDRVYGPTLTLKVCERAAKEGLSVYFYGSKSEVLTPLIANLKKQFPTLRIAGTQASLFRQTSADEKAEIAKTIRDSGASIVFVGLGCPRQETWVYEYRDLLPMPLLAVGAAFDFHAGTLPQAPQWIQNVGMEWFYRLVQEPRRLWKRYAILNPQFLWLLSLQLTGIRTVSLAQTIPPQEELRYG